MLGDLRALYDSRRGDGMATSAEGGERSSIMLGGSEIFSSSSIYVGWGARHSAISGLPGDYSPSDSGIEAVLVTACVFS